MPLEEIKEVASYLSTLDGYKSLFNRHKAAPEDRSTWFEMVFAYWLHHSGLTPEYEVNVNPESDKNVDFVVRRHNRVYCMELTRIENSAEVQQHIEQQLHNGDSLQYGLLLKSDSKNPYFATAAQLIRLQEKVLEKGTKFAAPAEGVLSLVVVDCSNINVGILDEEDVRIAAYGRAKQPAFQEYWQGARLKGMFEEEFTFRHADVLRARLSAIVFLRKLSPDGLDDVFIASSPHKDVDDDVRELPVFSKIVSVKPRCHLI